jgi:hypothetical protein
VELFQEEYFPLYRTLSSPGTALKQNPAAHNVIRGARLWIRSRKGWPDTGALGGEPEEPREMVGREPETASNVGNRKTLSSLTSDDHSSSVQIPDGSNSPDSMPRLQQTPDSAGAATHTIFAQLAARLGARPSVDAIPDSRAGP